MFVCPLEIERDPGSHETARSAQTVDVQLDQIIK